MFTFTSKSGKAAARASQALRASLEQGIVRPTESAAEKAWWMDSAHELEQGLEVTEITEPPDELFSASGPR
ncbi:hypothetical protein [Caldimonas manganoxidans]|uniref:hypothetical protein n=1 Tax=Caldimonas manganoxidans TaxID=196015 RepID=UPI0003621DF0|nr:hypothetical protein [Caldimonas manganoxidans]